MSISMQYLLSIQVFLLLASSLFLSIKAQDRYCPPCEKSNITYLCKSLPTLGAKIRLCYYNTTPNATLDVVFSAPPPSPYGWVAWGMNPKRAQMVDSHVLIAHQNPDRSVNVTQAVLTRNTKHGCDIKSNGFEIKVYTANANYSEELRMMTLYAKLGLPHWCNSSRLSHVWQVGPKMDGDDTPIRHARRLQNFDSRETINLTNSQVLWPSHTNLRRTHGILGITGWGVLLPCGVIISRYFRWFPIWWSFWFPVHVGINIIAYAIGTAGWGIGLSLTADHFATYRAHRIIGIIIFSLATLQVLAIFLKPRKNDNYRPYWNIYHHFVGYTVLTLGVINIFKGIAILQPSRSWKHTYIILLIVLGSIAFLLEVFTWVKFYMPPLNCYRDKEETEQHNKQQRSSRPTWGISGA